MAITLDGTTGITSPNDTTGNQSYTGTLTGGTGVVNLGSGQFYKDASGNVGIGVTPASWSLTNYKALQVGNSALFGGTANGDSNFSSNAYYNSGWNYIVTAGASYYNQNGGSHIWYNAPSGTAGTAITFTERMRIDSSGNVGIGNSSPNTRLDVYANNPTSGQVCLFRNSATSSQNGVLTRYSQNGIADWQIGQPAAVSAFIFGTTASEFMRIDSSGNLLVGKTASGSSGVGTVLAPSGYFQSSVAGTATAYHALFYNNSGASSVGAISSNGSTTTYATSSDYRLKENIAPMTGALDKVKALKPVTYKWKADGSASQGFIAHELQEIVPECVVGTKDAVETVDDVNSEGKVIGTKEVPKYQGIDTSFLVATLTAAIQEQQALIESLTTRLTVLEAK